MFFSSMWHSTDLKLIEAGVVIDKHIKAVSETLGNVWDSKHQMQGIAKTTLPSAGGGGGSQAHT